MKLQKIKYLLMAQDMQRAVTFYITVFGLTPTVEGDFWSEMTFGDTIIALHGGGDGSRNPTDVSFQVDNIVVACKLIRENGGRVVAQPEQRPGEPIVLAVAADTEGNEIMLTQWVG